MNTREIFGNTMKQYYQTSKTSRQTGFTMLELMFVLAILAIATTIAIPSFNTIIQNNRIENEAYRIFSLLKTTRSNAITSNRRHFLCRTNNAYNNENGNGAACRNAGLATFDWNHELIGYRLLTGDSETIPNNRFNNQRLQIIASANTNAVKQQMILNFSAAGSDIITITANNNDFVLAFTPQGALLNDAPLLIAVCDERDDPEEYGQLITINAAGLIRLSKTDATDNDACTPT